MRMKGLDLNLLVALDVLLEECSVSKAARRLHVSQPAASAALGRLRDYFDDELLVLHGKRMIPTAYASSLVADVKHILHRVDDMIAMPSNFDPSRSERMFRFMASDYITTILLAPLASRLEKQAPGLRIDARLPDEPCRTQFERGEIDLMLVPEEFQLPGHPAHLVFEEPHVIVGWDQNPLFQTTIGTDEFFAAEHVGIRLGPNRDLTFTETHLNALAESRKVSVFAQNFSVVPWFVINTHRLAVMQSRLAESFKTIMPLATAPIPFEFPPMRVMAQFHTTRSNDQGLKWILEQLLSLPEIVSGAEADASIALLSGT